MKERAESALPPIEDEPRCLVAAASAPLGDMSAEGPLTMNMRATVSADSEDDTDQ